MAENTSTGRGERISSGGSARNVSQANPSEQRGNAQSGRTLMFVDSTANQAQSREAIRVHVMRESHRVRRLQQGQLVSSSNVGQLHIWNAGASLNADESRGSNRGSKTPEVDRSTRLLEAPGEPIAGPSTSISRLPATSHAVRVSSAEFPVYQRQAGNPPAASAGGELQLYSQAPGENVEALVGYYLDRMAPLSYDLLPLYRNDTASFHALLALAAMLLDIEQDHAQSLQLAQLEGQAIATIQGRIEQGLPAQANGTVMAVAIMAQLEEYRGDNSTARHHWSGLKQIITSQGGLQSVWAQRQLHSALFYLDLTTCSSAVTSSEQPYTTSLHGATSLASLATAQNDLSPKISLDGTTLDEAKEILKVSQEFIDFLINLATKTVLYDPSIIYHRRLTVPGIVVEIIDHPARRHCTMDQRILKCCKMACILYLAAILAEEHTTESMHDFLDSLNDKLLQRMADHDVCAEELLYVLLQGTGDPNIDNPERIWFVSRLMSAAKRLPTQPWDRVYSKVVDFLGLTDRLWVTTHPGLPLSQEDLQRELCSEACQLINLHIPYSQA